MTFEYPGYNLDFIQRDACRGEDQGGHLFTFIYKFFSPVTNYKYIVRAEQYECDAFAIKFYCQKHSGHDYKYSITTNKGDLGNIMITCLSVVEKVLEKFPNASFAFVGARSYDKKSKTIESRMPTQRFVIYKYIVSKLIGQATFEHFVYDGASSYALVNKGCGNVEITERMISNMFRFTYPNLRELQM